MVRLGLFRRNGGLGYVGIEVESREFGEDKRFCFLLFIYLFGEDILRTVGFVLYFGYNVVEVR